jgi:hypothetical protein
MVAVEGSAPCVGAARQFLVLPIRALVEALGLCASGLPWRSAGCRCALPEEDADDMRLLVVAQGNFSGGLQGAIQFHPGHSPADTARNLLFAGCPCGRCC